MPVTPHWTLPSCSDFMRGYRQVLFLLNTQYSSMGSLKWNSLVQATVWIFSSETGSFLLDSTPVNCGLILFPSSVRGFGGGQEKKIKLGHKYSQNILWPYH